MHRSTASRMRFDLSEADEEVACIWLQFLDGDYISTILCVPCEPPTANILVQILSGRHEHDRSRRAFAVGALTLKDML
jgi:hypothetical protein